MRKIIRTKNAPAPIGPYNQAILAGDTLYLSGQVAIDPASGELCLDDLETETRLVISNLKAVLNEAGMDLSNLVKCSIFLKNMDDFVAVNKIYSEYFEEGQAPARETVQVAKLPKDVNVEISGVAVL